MSVDLNQDISYRGFLLNDSAVRANIAAGSAAGRITGCVVDTIDISDVDVVQFREKRSATDGMDVGEVFLGGRRVRMAGTIYGVSRAAFYDLHQQLRATLSPTLAFRDDPAAKGFQPMYFSTPTTRVAEYPAEAVDGASIIRKRMLIMPQAFDDHLIRDQLGGIESDALAVPWSAVLYQRRPSIQSKFAQQVLFAPTSDATGNLVNRGDFYAPLTAVFVVTSAAGSIDIQAGDSNLTITVPASTGERIIRLDGEEKVLTVEESSIVTLRMDLITFTGQSTWPLIPPGLSPYSVTFTGVVLVP